jgi:hypothetical protein
MEVDEISDKTDLMSVQREEEDEEMTRMIEN